MEVKDTCPSIFRHEKRPCPPPLPLVCEVGVHAAHSHAYRRVCCVFIRVYCSWLPACPTPSIHAHVAPASYKAPHLEQSVLIHPNADWATHRPTPRSPEAAGMWSNFQTQKLDKYAWMCDPGEEGASSSSESKEREKSVSVCVPLAWPISFISNLMQKKLGHVITHAGYWHVMSCCLEPLEFLS